MFRFRVWSTGQQPIHIKIYLHFCLNTFMNTYCEASLCVICLLTINPSPHYCNKHSVIHVISYIKMPCESFTWKLVFMYDASVWKVRKRFCHKFQDITVQNKKYFYSHKKCRQVGLLLDKQKSRIKRPSAHWR
jgi:hypothetical protein